MSAQPVDLAQRIGAFITGFPVTGGYRVPDRAEREALAAGVLEVLDGRPDAARGRLATIGYTVRTLRRAGGDLAELCEPSWTGRGWGRVYVDVTRPARWSVQAPHPRSDLRTGRLAAEVFDRAPGGVLVLAGALRTAGEGDCADVAHRADSAFDAVCEALVARGLPAIQVHGFADASAPGHDVVVSPGPAPPGDAVRKAARLLDGQGVPGVPGVEGALRRPGGHDERAGQAGGRARGAVRARGEQLHGAARSGGPRPDRGRAGRGGSRMAATVRLTSRQVVVRRESAVAAEELCTVNATVPGR
ncbi:hypothetical protein [Streptomyces silvisoli]|uniref:Uncharacterized protein n=1 Tax=Streptomyces silvisoli TaxID=3034235 RepID=A0ABT5ZPB4_9ACTN|nr:hypothetical protein [Streptomyces silvisoli]MDF3291672.1 hypothetical protein [Streptomyces silvisoli]